MDILNLSHNNFNNKKLLKSKTDVEIHEPDLLSKVLNDCKLPVNTFLNDSLNNLIKRFERTQMLRLTSSVTRKSTLSHSLPNIFLPPYFDDDKRRDNEKQVQWVNKLNLDWGSLRSALRDTCDRWFKQGRSQSIPNLQRSFNKSGTTNSSDRYTRDVHQTTPVAFSDENQSTTNEFLSKADSRQTFNNERKSMIIETFSKNKSLENIPIVSHKLSSEKLPGTPATDNIEESHNIINSRMISPDEDKDIDTSPMVEGKMDLQTEKIRTSFKHKNLTKAMTDLIIPSCLPYEKYNEEKELFNNINTISPFTNDLEKPAGKVSPPKGCKRKSAGRELSTSLNVENSKNNEENDNVRKKKRRESHPPSSNANLSKTNSIEEEMKYRRIRTNAYVDPKPGHWSQELEKCGCKPSKGKERSEEHDTKNTVWNCTENCLNRLMYTECDPKTCHCGEMCLNQKIRKSKWVSGLKLIPLELKGRGVMTTKSIREGTLITEYVGEVIYEDTFQERMANLYRDDAHHYCLHLDREMLIDAYRSGSIARFVNHSCQPNCEMQKWMVNGAYRMCLFANVDISPNTELTYDYNFSSFNTKTAQICLCGASNCRGFIGGRPRVEQSEGQKDRKRLLLAFGRTLSIKEKMFVRSRSIFLVRARNLGRFRRLGISETKRKIATSTNTELKRRNSKKDQFLSQMSALNSVRSVRTRLLKSAQEDVHVTRTAQLAHILRDLYNTLLERKDPLNPGRGLVDLFVNELKPKKYPELYRVIGEDGIMSLNQVYCRLLDGRYATMVAFDQDILQMMNNIEHYAGKQSKAGKSVTRMRAIYTDLKMNAIAIYEALTDELFDETDREKLLSKGLCAKEVGVRSFSDNDSNDSSSLCKNKRRKQSSLLNADKFRTLGAEVIKCVCEYVTDAGHVMIQCDLCFVWQHVDCMNVARSSELIEVTAMDLYYCHICSNTPTKALIREIPQNFVSPERTFFWTLLCTDSTLLKVDDFIYISSEERSHSSVSDFTERIIMRICSLWKDSEGQSWMEGTLLLRPYSELLEKTETDNINNPSNRKRSLSMDFSSHKWHLKEVVYSDLTRILPLSAFIGRCHCLNNYTFVLGRPHLQNSDNNTDDVYLCDWYLNKDGKLSDVGASYLDINTQAYCFTRYVNNDGEKLLKAYTADELLKFDQKPLESCVEKVAVTESYLKENEKKLLRKKLIEKLLTKLSHIALQRTEKLPFVSKDSQVNVCEKMPSASLTINDKESFDHYSRKRSPPKKIVNCDNVLNGKSNNNLTPPDVEDVALSKERVKCKKGSQNLNKKEKKTPINKLNVPTKIRKILQEPSSVVGNNSLHEKNGAEEDKEEYVKHLLYETERDVRLKKTNGNDQTIVERRGIAPVLSLASAIRTHESLSSNRHPKSSIHS